MSIAFDRLVQLDEGPFVLDESGEETFSIIIDYHRAWRARDIEKLVSLFDPDVEYNDFFQGRRILPGELRAYLLAGMPAAGDETQLYTDRLRVDGDTAFLQYQITLRGAEGLTSFYACEALSVCQGLIVQVNDYTSLIGLCGGKGNGINSRAGVERLGLSSRQLSVLSSDMQQYFSREKPYLNPDLDLQQVSKATGYSRNQVSFFLNQVMGCSFYQYVNRIRLEYLLSLLEDAPANARIAILVYEAGFRSMSTCYRFFRDKTGCSPKAWLKQRRIVAQ